MQSTEKILLEFDPEIGNLLPALKKISAAFGYVSETDGEKLAEYFNVPLPRIYETASFYDLVKTKKQPDLIIQVCSGTHCAVNNSFKIISEIENLLKIKAGDNFNPKVKLEMISCLGQCAEGPIVIINNKVFTNVTVSGIYKILEGWI